METVRVKYILSRISGNAYILLKYYTYPSLTNPFIGIPEIYKSFSAIFDDTNYKRKRKRAY